MNINVLFKDGLKNIYIDVDKILYIDACIVCIYRDVNYPQHYTQKYVLDIRDIEKMEIKP